MVSIPVERGRGKAEKVSGSWAQSRERGRRWREMCTYMHYIKPGSRRNCTHTGMGMELKWGRADLGLTSHESSSCASPWLSTAGVDGRVVRPGQAQVYNRVPIFRTERSTISYWLPHSSPPTSSSMPRPGLRYISPIQPHTLDSQNSETGTHVSDTHASFFSCFAKNLIVHAFFSYRHLSQT